MNRMNINRIVQIIQKGTSKKYTKLRIVQKFSLAIYLTILIPVLIIIPLYRGALSSGQSVITIEKELDIVDNYLSIQKMRYDDKFTYQKDCDPAVMNALVPKLCLQPLVENSIYHGLHQISSGGIIRVTTKKNGNNLLLSVWDNGCGFLIDIGDALSMKHGYRHNSYGLDNINERLKLFSDESRMTIKSQSGDCTVQMSIPLKIDSND